jgi:hypothetical protein
MHTVRTWGFYVLGGAIHKLAELKNSVNVRDIETDLQWASWTLFDLEDKATLPIEVCKPQCAELSKAIDRVLKAANDNPTRNVFPFEISLLVDRAKKFEHVLESQLNELKIYLVNQTEWYSVTTLVEKGEDLIPSQVQSVLSDYAKSEMHQAGKCIAFNLPSAAGFHIIRALEDVVRSYYDAATGGKARPKNESMGPLISELEKEPNANKVILSALKQIKDLHRNPYIHDVVLTMDEVIILLGIAQSAIAAVGNELIRLKGTP